MDSALDAGELLLLQKYLQIPLAIALQVRRVARLRAWPFEL